MSRKTAQSLLFVYVLILSGCEPPEINRLSSWLHTGTECAGTISDVQLDILESNIFEAESLMLDEKISAWEFDGYWYRPEESVGWAVEFADLRSPDVPMHGFGRGIVPSYGEGTFSVAARFVEDDVILFQDYYTFGWSHEAYCEHEWVREV